MPQNQFASARDSGQVHALTLHFHCVVTKAKVEKEMKAPEASYLMYSRKININTFFSLIPQLLYIQV
jgi:hypothetical protein